MRIRELNIKKINLNEIDRTYPGQDILFKCGELYQFESGIYGYGNLITKMERYVENIIIEELDKVGCIQTKFPILQPREIWDKSKRWDNYTKSSDIMFTLKNNLGEYGLAPTAEECATIFGANRLQSEKNLPACYYQINEKFRKEIRTRGYLFRSRSFKMLDAYSFDKDEEGLKKTYEKVRNAYINIFKRIGIDVIPIAADNGSFGGNKSEEWMAITDIGEDTILYNGKIGLNTEILEKENYEEILKQEHGITDITDMKKYKTIELGHTFMLGTKYSETMDLKYNDSSNKRVPYCMGCYGIGIERIYTAILENSVLKNDDGSIKGLSLPFNIAPYKLQIIYKDTKEKEAFDLYEKLQSIGIPVIIDDREGMIGSKIKDCYVLGTPYMLIIGDKQDIGKYELESTKDEEKKIVTYEELVEILKR